MFEGQKGAMPENSDTTEKISGITDETIDNNIVIPKTKESKLHSFRQIFL